MANTWNSHIIFAEIAGMLADAQDRHVSIINLSSHLIRDLNAESIDFLDFMFRIGTIFKITLKYPEDFIDIVYEDFTVELLCKAVAKKLGVPWVAPVHETV